MQNILDLELSAYDYKLPTELIATRPAPGRHHSKLLVYDQKSDTVLHRTFKDLPDILSHNSQLILNKSKVFPCRLFGEKSSGGKCELFLLSLISESGEYPVLIKSSGKKHLGTMYLFENLEATLTTIKQDGTFLVRFNLNHQELLHFLEKNAQIPIPPYIRDGLADAQDLKDYQTVYAKDLGSVAAPTAGLHFTDEIFSKLSAKEIKQDFVTLHVGAGTFRPVTSANITEHQMHSEFFDISPECLKTLNTHQRNIIAVGTTSLRVLESVCTNDSKFSTQHLEKPYETDIFIYPGKKVNSVDGLLTNFHLPKSSLLMLVSALIGREKTLELYQIAIENKYRFFSYGDAMLILRESYE